MADKIEVVSLVNRKNSRKPEKKKVVKDIESKQPVIKQVPDFDPEKIIASITKNLENPKKVVNFTEKYEESLIKQLFEEDLKKKIEKHVDGEESEYYEETQSKQHRKRDGEWDVPLDEEILYFDPELSYEITGYRPITMTQGLDFDPTPFRAVGEVFDRTGNYTDYPRGCKPYADFWNEQLRRCTEGYTVGKYRITGDHYFFLNFYRMQTIDQTSTKATSGRNQSFPNFLAKQYEFFHYLEMCEYIGKDVCLLKARGLKSWTNY